MIITRDADGSWESIKIWEENDKESLSKVEGTWFNIDREVGMTLKPVTSFTAEEFKILFPNAHLPRKGSYHSVTFSIKLE